ncbi:uncharacterized protein F4812DRAFT_315787 [Daldinia caldariorum]|uniref:uncharacterized protein n=1 Tax=Daldinia caldariorum TaxID=326644 RepID=UPI002008185A|nr:uncharacterized protein F4812DRAFT_315787 [Daldinia caldariorum]KAI1470147.1 hypothetical protein F4812DRAFT_315787 [Daldinia caldariorum]
MVDIALKLIDNLFEALQIGDAEKGMLNGYFEKHVKNVDRNKLAAHALETVLTSLESNSAITGLHRDVLQNLIHLLRSEATGTQKKKHSTTIKTTGSTSETSAGPATDRTALKPSSNQLSSPTKPGHNVTFRINGESCSTGSLVETQKEHNLKDSSFHDDDNFNQHGSSSSTTSGAELNGPADTEMNLAVASLSDDTTTDSIEHAQSESPGPTSSSRLGPIDMPAKQTSTLPFTTILANGPETAAGRHEGSDRKLLPHEWREPIPLETLQVSNSADAQVDKADAIQSFNQQLRKNSEKAPWIDEPPNANQDKTAGYNPCGTYEPENPGYRSRRGEHSGRWGRHRGGNSTRANQPLQNGARRPNFGRGRGAQEVGSQTSIRTPPRRRRRRHDGSISVYGWGPGSEELKPSFRKWKATVERRGSPTPSESISHFTVGFTSDIGENLRNHPPNQKDEIW